jgi:UDP-N-acetylmuramate dehydrogenase
MTTFELGGPARWFVEANDEASLIDALDLARAHSLPVLVLGGGSNLVVDDAGFPGVVVRIAMRGVSMREEGDRTIVDVGAGEPWEPLVARTVDARLAGFECLSGIPGLVGGTPIQNVGAYGQDVRETIVEVRTVHRATREIRVRNREECRFAYRHSAFKDDARDEIVTSVRFALHRDRAPAVRYPELERAMKDRGVAPTLASVREVVLSLRRSKSMVIDPNDENRRSAGSFFTNPIVSTTKADDVASRAGDAKMPRFSAENGIKLSAAWLIERAGFVKGTRRGAVGISSRHALALVHHGGGTTRALLDLALEIVETVRARFDVTLRPEPVIVADHPITST